MKTTTNLPQAQRDLYGFCIETLADEAACLRERVTDLEADRDAYCELFKMTLHALAEQTSVVDRQRQTIAELRELLRRMPAELGRAA